MVRSVLLKRLLLVMGLLLVALEVPAAETSLRGITLVYTEQDATGESTTTRYFVNRDYLHIRESLSPRDFILFDRKQQTIYIVTNSEKTIFVIGPKPVSISPPIPLGFTETLDDGQTLPRIAGQEVHQYRFTANGELCYLAAVMTGETLADAARALFEFKQVMAGEHATTVGNIPPSMLNACDLALNVFHAGQHLKHGVPVRESGAGAAPRYLQDFQLDGSLLAADIQLPVDYQRFSIGDNLIENAK